MPSHIKTYDESEDSEDPLKIFQAAAKTERLVMPTWCHIFNSTLTGNAKLWFDDLLPESIDSYDDLKKAFLEKLPSAEENNGQEQPKVTKKGETFRKDKALAILMIQPWERVARQRITQSFSPNPEIFFPPLGEDEGTEGPMIIEAKIRGHCIHRILRTMELLEDQESKLQAVPSIAHGMLKIPVEGGVITIKSSKLVSMECAMVSGPGETPSAAKPIIEERVKVAINPEYPEQTIMIVSTLTERGRNKSCGLLQRRLSAIENRLEGGVLVRIPFQILPRCIQRLPSNTMATKDEDKTAFITSQGIFCYTKMPIGLRNAGATYQRLVDKAFHKQIGRNLEAYVDDLVIKSRTKDEIVRDVEETFKTLRGINMKLNPKKCAFGVEEGMFLGYKVNAKGLKVCPDKVDVVLSLPSPKCLKDVQKLNGKLASLISDFHWTTKAEEAFKQMKQLIAELPMLTAPMEKKELIVYIAAVKETVSAVLMTEREAKQMPIYFVSRALRGPELNYTLMEKLVLALVHASKHLKRPRVSVKGQILADFIVERPEGDSLDTPIEEEGELPEHRFFTDGSSCTDGSEVGLILTNPEGMEFTYALRF
nr:reverse transcriptase domain-containing protein [Tanacetum cinerariifolium]